ncbi:MAG: site-specific integrase [Anaerolineales bacterium]
MRADAPVAQRIEHLPSKQMVVGCFLNPNYLSKSYERSHQSNRKAAFVFNKSETQQERALTSSALRDAYTDFVLSRQAMLVTNSTLEFYDYTLGGFLNWLEAQNVSRPDDIETHHVRTFLAQLKAEEKTSWTVNGFGRAIRTLLRFWYAEKYMHASINFVLPKVEQKRQPTLSAA